MNSATTCAAQGGVWRPGKAAPSQVVFRSVDEGRSWKYQGVIADPAEYADPHSSTFSVVGSTSELAIAQLADGRTLTAVWRPDGDCGCHMDSQSSECGVYRYYWQTFSTDMVSGPRSRLAFVCLLRAFVLQSGSPLEQGARDGWHRLRQAATALARRMGRLATVLVTQRSAGPQRRPPLRGE